MKRMSAAFGVFFLTALLSANSLAITWYPKEFECPIDKEINTFMVVGSYGSYIYSYPSKYQWLFFPATDSPTFYVCKKCHLATYMWDFDKLPKDKIPELKKVLATIKAPKAFKEYTEVPITERLEIMEKVYTVLGKDPEWWENFYRIKGYHYGKDGQAEKAAEERKRSLEFIQKELKNEKSTAPKKVLFYISGAMKHFLNDDKGALEDMQKALETKFAEAGATATEVKDAEEGLNERLKEYIEKIKSEKDKPRLFDKGGSDEH